MKFAARMQCDFQLLPKQETSSIPQQQVPTPPHRHAKPMPAGPVSQTGREWVPFVRQDEIHEALAFWIGYHVFW